MGRRGKGGGRGREGVRGDTPSRPQNEVGVCVWCKAALPGREVLTCPPGSTRDRSHWTSVGLCSDGGAPRAPALPVSAVAVPTSVPPPPRSTWRDMASARGGGKRGVNKGGVGRPGCPCSPVFTSQNLRGKSSQSVHSEQQAGHEHNEATARLSASTYHRRRCP